jgi:hypothetical protein
VPELVNLNVLEAGPRPHELRWHLPVMTYGLFRSPWNAVGIILPDQRTIEWSAGTRWQKQ